VICGCFKGTIAEFKAKVEARHGLTSDYANQYFNWIKKVEQYKN
jgi:hypothetical protein